MTLDREHLLAELRRDAHLIQGAAVTAVIVSFLALALGATVIDLWALRP